MAGVLIISITSYIIVPHVKIVSSDWLNEVHHSMLLCSGCNMTADSIFPCMSNQQRFGMVSEKLGILPLWGLFGIIKQIWHPSGGNLMEWIPLGGWFLTGFALRKTILSWGSIPSGYPHWDVIYVYCYSRRRSSVDQCLTQYLETGCLKLAVVKFLGVQIFKRDHNILIFQP